MTLSALSVPGPNKDAESPKVLRLGVLLDSLTLPAWVCTAVNKVKQLDGVTIDAVLLVNRSSPGKSIWRKLWIHRRLCLYQLYSKADKALFGRQPDPFAPTGSDSQFEGVPVLALDPAPSRIVDRFPESQLSSIKALNLDVVLNFDHRILRGGILGVARQGVWSLHHGDYERYRGGPPGFWEVMEGEPVTGSMLQVLTEELDNGRVLCRGFSATDPTSVCRNRTGYFWKSAVYFARELQKLQSRGNGDTDHGDQQPISKPLVTYSRPLYKPPANFAMAKRLVRHGGRSAARFISNRLRYDQWRLSFCFSDVLPTSMRSFSEIKPPKGRFWADPHVVARDGRYFIFFEEYDYRRRKGHISVVEMNEQGVIAPAQIVLDRPYHLSYPFVFDWAGCTYMIPESSANRTIELYKCLEFPFRWELCHNLMEDVEAVDATLHNEGDRWWMFAGIAATEGASPWDELHLFYADTPISKSWTAHTGNPVVSDVRRARPAGSLFSHQGRLYRPSQNCTPTYGFSLRLNEVCELNDRVYREVEAAHIEPTWEPGQYGVHTWSRAGRLTVVDVKRRPWRWT